MEVLWFGGVVSDDLAVSVADDDYTLKKKKPFLLPVVETTVVILDKKNPNLMQYIDVYWYCVSVSCSTNELAVIPSNPSNLYVTSVLLYVAAAVFTSLRGGVTLQYFSVQRYLFNG